MCRSLLEKLEVGCVKTVMVVRGVLMRILCFDEKLVRSL